MLIDVHVLVYPCSPQNWLDQCLDSLKNEPINLFIINAEDNRYENIGNYRIEGFSKGTEKYVSYVDADDYIIPGTFSKIINDLHDSPNVACTLEKLYYEERKEFHPVAVSNHHIKVFKRPFIKNFFHIYEKWGPYSDKVTMSVIGKKNVKKLNYIGYVWRIHENGWHLHINRKIKTKQIKHQGRNIDYEVGAEKMYRDPK